MPNPIDVSIIIINWNTREILRDCLTSVFKQMTELTFEVIVVDNDSHDDSVQMIKDGFPSVTLIENRSNVGFATANNQGMKVACGRYILLLNSDTLVLNGAIQKTVSFADKHPEAGVVGCRVLNPDRSLQPTCFLFPSLYNLLLSSLYLYKVFPRSRHFGRERMTWWDRSDIRDVDVVTGCFMLVPKSVIQQVGLMDSEYFMYAEEADWCYRIKTAGYRNTFYPGAEIIHLGGQSSKQVRIKSIVQVRLGILQFLFKNKSMLEYLASGVMMILFFMLRIPICFIKSLYGPTGGESRNRAKAYALGCFKVMNVIVFPRVENFRA